MPTLPRLPEIGEEVSIPKLKILAHAYRQVDIPVLLDALTEELHPFKSDGCSLWPDEWFKKVGFVKFEKVSLYPACFWHDVRYWLGKPGDDIARLNADALLMIEVAGLHSIKLGELMFAGVRALGGEEIGASFSWGFGRMDGGAKIKSIRKFYDPTALETPEGPEGSIERDYDLSGDPAFND